MRNFLLVLCLVYFALADESVNIGNVLNEYGSADNRTETGENLNGTGKIPWFQKSSARKFLRDFEPELRNFYLSIYRKYRNQNRDNNLVRLAKMKTNKPWNPHNNIQRKFYSNRFSPYYNNLNRRQWTTRYPYWREYDESYNENRRMTTSTSYKTTQRRFYPNRFTQYYNNWNRQRMTEWYWKQYHNRNSRMTTSNPYKTTRRRFYPNQFTPYYNNWNRMRWNTEFWRGYDKTDNQPFEMTTPEPWNRHKTTRRRFYPNKFTQYYNNWNRRRMTAWHWRRYDEAYKRNSGMTTANPWYRDKPTRMGSHSYNNWILRQWKVDNTIRNRSISKINKTNQDSHFSLWRPNSFWFEVGLVIVSGIAFVLFISLSISVYNGRKLVAKLKKGKTLDGQDNIALQLGEMPPSYYESVENEPIIIQNV